MYTIRQSVLAICLTFERILGRINTAVSCEHEQNGQTRAFDALVAAVEVEPGNLQRVVLADIDVLDERGDPDVLNDTYSKVVAPFLT